MRRKKKEMGLGFSIMNGSFITLISMFLIYIINTHHIPTPTTMPSVVKYIGTIFAISVALGVITFFISKFLNNKIIENYE